MRKFISLKKPLRSSTAIILAGICGAILIWAISQSISFAGTDNIVMYQAYLDHPLIILTTIALLICVICSYMTRPKQRLNSLVPASLILIAMIMIGLGFSIRYQREWPIRAAQNTVESLKAPPQFGSKSLTTLPGDFDRPTEQWATNLTGSQACQELPEVIAMWEHDSNYVAKSNPASPSPEISPCDFVWSLNHLPIETSVYVSTYKCSPAELSASTACSQANSSKAIVVVTATAKTNY